jgi:hypothetical protein
LFYTLDPQGALLHADLEDQGISATSHCQFHQENPLQTNVKSSKPPACFHCLDDTGDPDLLWEIYFLVFQEHTRTENFFPNPAALSHQVKGLAFKWLFFFF